MPRQATRTDYIVLFALGALWGSSFGAIKIALHGVTPLTVMSVRILLAGAALLLLTFLRKTQFPRGAQNWIKIIWMAILGTLMPFYLVPWGQLQNRQQSRRNPDGSQPNLRTYSRTFF
mgnify:CR=1 FL=1